LDGSNQVTNRAWRQQIHSYESFLETRAKHAADGGDLLSLIAIGGGGVTQCLGTRIEEQPKLARHGGDPDLVPALQRIREALELGLDATPVLVIATASETTDHFEALPVARDMAEGFSGKGLQVHVLGCGEEANQDQLFELSKAFGGMHHSVVEIAKMKEIFGDIAIASNAAEMDASIFDAPTDWPGHPCPERIRQLYMHAFQRLEWLREQQQLADRRFEPWMPNIEPSQRICPGESITARDPYGLDLKARRERTFRKREKRFMKQSPFQPVISDTSNRIMAERGQRFDLYEDALRRQERQAEQDLRYSNSFSFKPQDRSFADQSTTAHLSTTQMSATPRSGISTPTSTPCSTPRTGGSRVRIGLSPTQMASQGFAGNLRAPRVNGVC
jgi:hypothetical protein